MHTDPETPCPDAAGLIDLIWQDEAVLIVRKPAGLLSVPGRGPALQDCVASRVQARWPDALIVHRLDMATSGLLVMARGLEAQRRLSQAFAERRVDKEYTAVVHGLPDDDSGQIDLPLMSDWPNRPRQRVDAERGKPALTHWRVLQRDAATGTTRLLLQPVTGRTHQLRVHLLAVGHPIVGDALYGPPPRPDAPRLLLHASRIGLPHPDDGRRLDFSDAAPF